MAKEVTQTVAKPMEVKKVSYTDETDPITISAELKKESQLITTTASSNQQSKPIKKTYEQMIIDAITENDPRRKGLSFTLIKKFIKGKYQIEGEITYYVKKAFEKLSSKDTVERVSGMGGMHGSIRLTKAHIAKVSKQFSAKSKPKNPKKTKVLPKKKPKKDEKDRNNNDKKKGKADKPKPTLQAKPSTKKTAITKTKIARSGGKVRLSIVASTDPSPSTNAKMAKAKRNASKTTVVAEKSAKPKGEKNAIPRMPKPKPAKARSEKKE
ncbi:uncharacterized protein LOC128305811 [Anopheles moucheti]|uniref:uncharacterized protein LOC128305811 n=1 Tax=Anopheles moucheti TaxID=186751 RepID=UPI0022F0585F|nr:uncharacterized protein LOC128305811 [Anopheles moucheti]